MKTIIALATPPLSCAIHVIRISGPETYEIVSKLSQAKIAQEGFKIQRIWIYNLEGAQIDEVLISKFVSPKSYTGEDLIEINCHGSLFIARKIIDLAITHGAQMATPGEFTKRALLNNKINLTQAEAIYNLNKADNDVAIQHAIPGVNRELFLKITDFKNKLFDMLGKLEINIDYPEYNDVPIITHAILEKNIADLLINVELILKNSQKIIKIKDGINVAIIGKPNVGKSSLLNSILKENRAIVSSTPGTTRDIIIASALVNGIKINFLDTAGLRKTKNLIEKKGVKKTLEVINTADLILFMIDNSKKITASELKLYDSLKSKKHLLVMNKSDLSNSNNINGIKVSAKKNEIDDLLNGITDIFATDNFAFGSAPLLQNEHEISLMKKIKINLQKTLADSKNKQPLDLLADFVRDAYEDLSSILGDRKDNNFIDELFLKFCVGK